MQGKYLLFTFCVIFLLIAPAAASLNKIAATSPVFIGEKDIDISSALNGCRIIAWWQNGTSPSGSPAKNITLFEISTAPDNIYHFDFKPEIFTGYTGTWYCDDKKPNFPVFDLHDPQISLKIWDLDKDQDVTGMAIPRATNITYRIDTNLYPALKNQNRPNSNPSDGFFTVKLTDPLARNVPNIYTGSYGLANTLILPFENNPYVTSSPYLWRNGNVWDHAARNIQGDMIYPPGTYSFTLTQNLNRMQESYGTIGGNESTGKTSSSATVTFLVPEPLVVTTSLVTVATTLPQVTNSTPVTTVTPTTLPTSPVIAKKTTYAPLPAWIALLGIGIAGFLAIVRRNS
ncbi:MAG: DUF3821 domain-containing protein [Methanoregula sp.]|nr:DUF3821 domain-containing protein [Methanoregula sp.]